MNPAGAKVEFESIMDLIEIRAHSLFNLGLVENLLSTSTPCDPAWWDHLRGRHRLRRTILEIGTTVEERSGKLWDEGFKMYSIVVREWIARSEATALRKVREAIPKELALMTQPAGHEGCGLFWGQPSKDVWYQTGVFPVIS